MKITKSILFLIFAFLIVGFVSSPGVGLETDTIEESNLLFCSPFYNPFCYSLYEDYYLAMETLHIDLIKNELEFNPANNYYPGAYYQAAYSPGFWITDPNGTREWIPYPVHPYAHLFY